MTVTIQSAWRWQIHHDANNYLLLPPTGGTVTVGGFDIVDQPIFAKKLIGWPGKILLAAFNDFDR